MKRVAAGYGLLEAARWYPEEGILFSDITRGGVFRLQEGEDVVQVLPHRKGIGGMALHANGGLIVSGRNVAWKSLDDPDAPTQIILELRSDERSFNDMTCDAAGRLYVGSLGAVGDGRLYRIDLDGRASVLGDGIAFPNGIGLSPSGMTAYHVDTDATRVIAYDLENPHIRRTVIHSTVEYGGLPDGLAVDSDGTIWVAIARAGRVLGFDPEGTLVGDIPVPQPLVTSLAFGGAQLRSLFLVTGSEGEDFHPDGGCVYVHDMTVSGLPSHRCQIELEGS